MVVFVAKDIVVRWKCRNQNTNTCLKVHNDGGILQLREAVRSIVLKRSEGDKAN